MSHMGLLRTDRQTRAEALPIFYRENTFSFSDVEAVIPFLKDRPVVTRQMISRLDLIFDVYDCDEYHPCRQSGWIKTMKYLSLFMNLTTLFVAVLDWTSDLMNLLKTRDRKERWLQALAQIHGLDEIQISITFCEHDEYIEGIIDDIGWINMFPTETDPAETDRRLEQEIEDLIAWEVDVEDDYQLYLQARCLEKRQITLDGWLEKHICGCLCSCWDVKKGRAARQCGLPKSETNGSWVLPEVDLEALYDSERDFSDFSDLTDDEYTDSEDDFSEDDPTEEDASALPTSGVDSAVKCT
ncbi:MAG: hypothetical protein Q9174_004037 [Haloplaca sp. 1 TL-2023]